MNKIISTNVTSYDLLKSAALLLMLVDHIGYFFYPDDMWFRVAGRLCVPVWCFLIGYANSRDMGFALWAGMITLAIAKTASGIPFFPLNILALFLFIRLILDGMMPRLLKRPEAFWGASVLILLLAIPSYAVVEYGAEGLLLAMFGYLVRHRQEAAACQKNLTEFFMAFCLAVFMALESMIFGFTQPQVAALAAGSLLVFGLLYIFKPGDVFRPVSFFHNVLARPLQFMGRHTLALYVGHILLFLGLSLWLSPERFHFLSWNWTGIQP